MPYDIETLTNETLVHVGDRYSRYFSRDEVKRTIVEGYFDLCQRARPIWDVYMVDGPVVAATVDLPANLLQVERATWDGRRLEPLHSWAFEKGLDFGYQTETGDVSAYMLNKDGIGKMRLYKAPASSGPYIDYTGSTPWGTIRAFLQTAVASTTQPSPRLGMFARMTNATTIYPADQGMSLSPVFGFLQAVLIIEGAITSIGAFLGFTITGTGVLRMISGLHPSQGVRGIVRSFRFDSRNLRIEYHRRPHDPRTYRQFELPDYSVRYVRHYVMAKLYRRDGPFQDLKMSKSFMLRYTNAVERLKLRMASIDNATHHILGSGGGKLSGPPLAQLPWNYPARTQVRRRR